MSGTPTRRRAAGQTSSPVLDVIAHGAGSVVLEEPYATREISDLGIQTLNDWRMKVYGIAYGRRRPRHELVVSAIAMAASTLPRPAVTDLCYGVAFLGVHDGRGANFVFVDWWECENELHHHLFFSPADDPTDLSPATGTDPVACVWDLTVLEHERAAWVRHVLARPEGPDLAAYCADVLTGAF